MRRFLHLLVSCAGGREHLRRLPTAAMVVLSAGIVAGALVVDADTDVLGTVVIQVEQAASSETYGFNTPQPGPAAPADPRAPRQVGTEKDENGRQVPVYRCCLAWCNQVEDRTKSVVQKHIHDAHKERAGA